MSTILIVGAAACVMMIMEIVVPGRRWPSVGGWWVRAIALNLVQAGMVFVAGVTWDRWFAGASLWSLEDMLGRTGGAIVGYLVITFVYYWWHRARHEIPILWRWLPPGAPQPAADRDRHQLLQASRRDRRQQRALQRRSSTCCAASVPRARRWRCC